MLSIRYKFDLSAFLKHFLQMDFNVYKCLYCVLCALHHGAVLHKRFSNDIYLGIHFLFLFSPPLLHLSFTIYCICNSTSSNG